MSQQTRFCPNCSAVVKPTSRFCPSCGKPLPPPGLPPTQVATPPPQAAYTPPPTPAYSPPPQYAPPVYPPTPAPVKSRSWLKPGLVGLGAGGLCLVVVVLLLVAGVISLPEKDKKEEKTPTKRPTKTATEESVKATKTLESVTLTKTLESVELTITLPPLATLAPTKTAAPGVSYEGIGFSFDPRIAASVIAETVDAVTGADLPPWELVPKHYKFNFNSYVIPDREAFILVYPAEDYIAVNPSVSDIIANLRQVLVQKSTTNLPDDMPFLPPWNAAQMMSARVHYFRFQNGEGVAYLTQYGQDVWPIENTKMFYTFQGQTDDKVWVVAAVLPVTNPILPPADSVNMDQAFYDNYPGYIKETEQKLAAQPADSFTPSLDLLDAIFRSLKIK